MKPLHALFCLCVCLVLAARVATAAEKAAAPEPKPAATEPKPVAPEPKPVAPEPKPAATEPKPAAAEPKPAAPEPKAAPAAEKPAAVEGKPDPREDVKTAIPEGIRLLEAKDYAKFLNQFVSPDDMTEITRNLSPEEFATEFGRRSAADLLGVLKEVKDKSPTMNEAKTKATFKLDKPVRSKKEITFVKVDKFWYIDDK